MPATATFARVRLPRALVFERSWEDLSEPLLMVDLVGETQSMDLVTRLRTVDIVANPSIVVLRGLSQALFEQLEAEAQHFLADFFPTATSIYCADFTPSPTLTPVKGPVPSAPVREALLSHLAQAELEAHLTWTDGIWASTDYHFVVPSGEHADVFVRLSDVFADPIALSRLADWKLDAVTGPTLLVADTPAMLPLLQELRLRRNRAADARILILPLYALSPDEAELRLAEVMPWCIEHNANVVAFISVASSGGYQHQLDRLCERIRPPSGLTVHVLCEASATRTTKALAHIPTRRYPNERSCNLCRESSTSIEVDTQRFAAQLLFGSRIVPLPPPKQLQELSFLLQEADREGAFKVHVERPLFGRHLGIAIDPSRLLRSRVFRAQATLSLARAQSAFQADLVLIPHHDSTTIIQEWLQAEGIANAEALPMAGAIPDTLTSKIRSARCILLCDAGMITSRTLRACVEIVQRTKGDVDDFKLKALVLVARPDILSTWRGISDRFFIRLDRNLEAAWVLTLPDHLSGSDCPWCAELKWLQACIHQCRDECRSYVEQRIARLSAPDGLSDRVFLGSELCECGPDQYAGVHTTPNSYFGNLTDIGMFVAQSSVLQLMRNEWRKSKEFFTTKMALPLPDVLRRFTDPIIPAAVLRAAKPIELRAPAILQELRVALTEIGHARQHVVLMSELLYGIATHRLPISHREVGLLAQLEADDSAAARALFALFASVLTPSS